MCKQTLINLQRRTAALRTRLVNGQLVINMEANERIPVSLHAYDLTPKLSVIARPKDEKDFGVWYTGIVAFGKEYFFSQLGVESSPPAETLLGEPTKIEYIGNTEISFSIFIDFILTLSETKYRPGKYHLKDLNGNTFTDDVAQFICGVGLPKYIFRIPHVVFESPVGEEEVLPLLEKVSERGITVGGRSQNFLLNYVPKDPRRCKEPSPDLLELQAQIEAIKADQRTLEERRQRIKCSQEESVCHSPVSNDLLIIANSQTQPLDVEQRVGDISSLRKEKRVSFDDHLVVLDNADKLLEHGDTVGIDKRKKSTPTTTPTNSHSSVIICANSFEDTSNMDDTTTTTANNEAGVISDCPSDAERRKKDQKPKEPPITFRDFDHAKDFEDLVRTIVTKLSGEEQDRLREMEDWIMKNEGTWVLGEGFNAFLGRVLHDKTLPTEGRVAMLRLFGYGAGQEDIVLILHMDRKDHIIMSYAQQFDRLPILEQENLALLFANLFETNSSSEWLLYISEWKTANNSSQELSNVRVTTKVAVNALLGDTQTLQNYGSAIMHNLSTKEVFDDVCSELAMAILQFFQDKHPEEQIFYCMKALNKFCAIAHRDVPQLVKMVGPQPTKFSGMSVRIDEQIKPIMTRLDALPSF